MNIRKEEKKEDSEIERSLKMIQAMKDEVSKIVVGQTDVVNGIIRAIIANGHVLIEGVPGIAKTLIIRAIASVTGCKFGRIQFTVDLLPTDIIGITTLSADRTDFEIMKGPIFANFVIADEINRAPPKTQSALLEAMAEKQVTISRNTYDLDQPFFVMATQNPIESSGTYPLPEAQMDRFLFKLVMKYPEKEKEQMIIEQNTAFKQFGSYNLNPVMNPEDIIKIQEVVHQIQHTQRINRYIVDIVDATRKPGEYGVELGRYIDLGASPRASIYMFVAAKADALMNGKKFVTPHNVKTVAYDILRHRINLNYKAKIEKVSADNIIKEILSKVKVP